MVIAEAGLRPHTGPAMRMAMSLGLLRLLPRAPLPCRLLSTSTSLHSPLAPTFSSTGDTKTLVTRLGLHRISNVIIQGSPNIKLPKEFNVNPDDFLPGAREAVGLVTKSASEGDWEGLEGLVEPRCIDSLREQLEGMGEVERGYVALDPKDVFFSFISNELKCDKGNNLNVVTFSLPGMHKVHEERELFKAKFEEMKASGDVNKEKLVELMKETRDQTGVDANDIFNNNEIVIGNYRFIRESSDSQWVVTEVGQANTKTVFHPLFRFKWRGRLGISLKAGFNFMKVLRVDYGSDWIWLIIVFFVFVRPIMLGQN